MKEFKIYEIYLNDDKYSIEFRINNDGEHENVKFENVKAYKRKRSKCENCKEYCERNFVLRRFDCQRNVKKLILIYQLITVFLIIAVANYTFNMSIVKCISINILFFIFLDIVCTLIEDNFENVRNGMFYNNLKKRDQENKRKEEEKKRKEEEEKIRAENEQRQKIPDIIVVEKTIEKLEELSNKSDFGTETDKIRSCINNLKEMIEIIKKNSTAYNRVAYLFEIYLPEFYTTLNLYAQFSSSGKKSEENDNILQSCVEKFDKFLNEQKSEVICDVQSVETAFRASAKALSKLIDQ